MLWKTIAVSSALLVVLGIPAAAKTKEIYPSVADCDEEFENAANSLAPGDVLILHGGIYSQQCRRAITDVGTPSQPIVIRAAEGETPILTRPKDNMDTQNNIEIVDCSYLVMKGLVFEGGSTGVRFIGGNHITLEDCEIRNTGNNAVAMNSGDSDHFVIRHNHIHHTGLSTSGTTEGEGMYLGCNNAECKVTNTVVERNYIHHLRGTSDGGNDGIEVKPGSYNIVIRDNVIHDTNIGRSYPCIFVYGGGEEPNIVEGNAVWNCGEGIQVISDALVQNNLVLNSSIGGITSTPHAQVAVRKNVHIVNNTVYGHPECLRADWTGTQDMVLANNALYCEEGTAVHASGLDHAGVTVLANLVQGAMEGASVDGTRFVAGGLASKAFTDPSSLDFWPTPESPLRGAAHADFLPEFDFNWTRRTAPYDVGAYEVEDFDSNPGWTVSEGFKDSNGPPASTPPAAPRNLRVK